MGRAELSDRFVNETRHAKSWVVETHSRDVPAVEFLRSVVSKDDRVEAIDGTLTRIDVGGDESFAWWVDSATPRFWRYHTWEDAGPARQWLKHRIERTSHLDWTWFPSGQLRQAAGENSAEVDTDFGGRLIKGAPKPRSVVLRAAPEDSFVKDALAFLEQADSPVARYLSVGSVRYVTHEAQEGEDFSSIVALQLSRDGRVMARGNDWNLHGRAITAVVRRYRRLIELIETRRLTSTLGPDRSGWSLAGSPITMHFQEPSDMDHLLEALFSCREPFRLWGHPREADGYWTVEGSDLHVGQRISLDIGPSWLRVYLRDGVCGNTVVRLASNLEHNLDARLRFSDPKLHELFAGKTDAQVSAA